MLKKPETLFVLGYMLLPLLALLSAIVGLTMILGGNKIVGAHRAGGGHPGVRLRGVLRPPEAQARAAHGDPAASNRLRRRRWGDQPIAGGRGSGYIGAG